METSDMYLKKYIINFYFFSRRSTSISFFFFFSALSSFQNKISEPDKIVASRGKKGISKREKIIRVQYWDSRQRKIN